LLATAIAHQASLTRPPPTAAPPSPPVITATAAGHDLRLTFDTDVAHPAGLVVTVGDPHQPTPPAIHRVPVEASSGTVVIPGAAGAGETIHVSVAASDGRASAAAQTQTKEP
jgi:hypothetical protein